MSKKNRFAYLIEYFLLQIPGNPSHAVMKRLETVKSSILDLLEGISCSLLKDILVKVFIYWAWQLPKLSGLIFLRPRIFYHVIFFNIL